MEKEILALILGKLENIEKEQKEMRKEQQEMKKEILGTKTDLQGMKTELYEMKTELYGMKSELQVMQGEIFKRLDRLEKGQESIKEFIFNAEKTFEICEQDHIFIEKLKKVACE